MRPESTVAKQTAASWASINIRPNNPLCFLEIWDFPNSHTDESWQAYLPASQPGPSCDSVFNSFPQKRHQRALSAFVCHCAQPRASLAGQNPVSVSLNFNEWQSGPGYVVEQTQHFWCFVFVFFGLSGRRQPVGTYSRDSFCVGLVLWPETCASHTQTQTHQSNLFRQWWKETVYLLKIAVLRQLSFMPPLPFIFPLHYIQWTDIVSGQFADEWWFLKQKLTLCCKQDEGF